MGETYLKCDCATGISQKKCYCSNFLKVGIVYIDSSYSRQHQYEMSGTCLLDQ